MSRRLVLTEAPRNEMASQLNVGYEVTGEQKGPGSPPGRNSHMKEFVAQGLALQQLLQMMVPPSLKTNVRVFFISTKYSEWKPMFLTVYFSPSPKIK